MDRSLWLQHFDKNVLPTWPCPACGKGHVSLVQKSFTHKETASSERSKESPDWDPEWIEYVFACWGQCSNSSCKQPFAITGKGGIAPYIDEMHGEEWGDYFQALTCNPMPHFISMPNKCPSEVSDPLKSAFAVFWISPEACAGRIRVSLEALMNHMGIPKRHKTKKGTFVEMTLHARIDRFAKSDPANGTQLLALKWLGNAGSHDSGMVSHNDLLDAFEIMEHALAELIDKRSKRVAALAKQLTKKHSK